VRNATTGMPVMETAAAPFADGPWLFSHNGASPAGRTRGRPRRDLADRDLLTLDAPPMPRWCGRWCATSCAGADPVTSIVDVLHAVLDAAPGSRLNLLLTDGRTAVATTWWHALSVRRTADATLISSEPLDDDPAWQAVPDRHLVVATAGTVELTPLT
jgi:glutamine amidotransferase